MRRRSPTCSYSPSEPRSELGELSFVFINGTLLHAIRKEPKGWSANSAQPVTRLDEPPAEAESIARRALEAARKLSVVYEVDGEGRLTRAYTWCADESIYLARVDLLPGNDGHWLVSELELGWPHLFLRAAEGGTVAAAKAVAEALLHRLEGEVVAEAPANGAETYFCTKNSTSSSHSWTLKVPVTAAKRLPCTGAPCNAACNAGRLPHDLRDGLNILKTSTPPRVTTASAAGSRQHASR